MLYLNRLVPQLFALNTFVKLVSDKVDKAFIIVIFSSVQFSVALQKSRGLNIGLEELRTVYHIAYQLIMVSTSCGNICFTS